MADFLKQYLADFEFSEKDCTNEINSILQNPDHQSGDIKPKAIAMELICAELLLLRNNVLISIDPSFRGMLHDIPFKIEDPPEKLMDEYFKSIDIPQKETLEDSLRRLGKARLLHRILNRQIQYILRNVTTIKNMSPRCKRKQ